MRIPDIANDRSYGLQDDGSFVSPRNRVNVAVVTDDTKSGYMPKEVVRLSFANRPQVTRFIDLLSDRIYGTGGPLRKYGNGQLLLPDHYMISAAASFLTNRPERKLITCDLNKEELRIDGNRLVFATEAIAARTVLELLPQASFSVSKDKVDHFAGTRLLRHIGLVDENVVYNPNDAIKNPYNRWTLARIIETLPYSNDQRKIAYSMLHGLEIAEMAEHGY